MGYPMTYPRVIGRNRLFGDYDGTPNGLLAGDLRRLEKDAIDSDYGHQIAAAAGVTPEDARSVLVAFFGDCGGVGWIPSEWKPPTDTEAVI